MAGLAGSRWVNPLSNICSEIGGPALTSFSAGRLSSACRWKSLATPLEASTPLGKPPGPDRTDGGALEVPAARHDAAERRTGRPLRQQELLSDFGVLALKEGYSFSRIARPGRSPFADSNSAGR